MNRRLHISIVVSLVVVFFLLGCELLSTALAPAPTATSVARSTAPLSATSAPPSGQASSAPTSTASNQAKYDGEWKGKSSTDSTIAFSVQNDQVTDITVNYNGPAGTCRNLSLSYTNSVTDAQIKGRDFVARADFRDGELVTLTGTFASNVEASGSVTLKGKFESCGDYEVKATWTAKTSSASNGVNPLPSRPPTSAFNPADAEKIVRGFFNAINAKQVDAALAFVDDDIIFTSGSSAVIGKDQVRSFLAGQTSRGVAYTLSNVQAVGDDTVTFSLKVGAGAMTDGDSAILDEGKIQILTLR